ncbi:UDP-3-O-acyl-N-acetylglucosamine deacetylase [bacterium HR15]|nr:UDP-3-O-acyl-N-acetylglucosamine deacetylase [bacterium HR15]
MGPHLPTERWTLTQPVDITGVGLHTGESAQIRLHPYQGGLRVRKGTSEFPVRWDYVRDTRRAVTLGNEEFTLGTVEHLLAAFWALGMTDCLIEVLQGREVPILDGSALPFIEIIEASGGTMRVALDNKKTRKASHKREDKPPGEPKQHHRQTEATPLSVHGTIPVLEPVWVQQEDRVVGVLPGNLYAFGYISFPGTLGEQGGYFDLRQFREQIAPARTFGFLHEVASLQQQGLALGGSLDNVLLITPDGYYNNARFGDEPLRHKILDVIGDLMLCGAPLSDFVLVAVKPGHALDVQLASAIAQRLPQWLARMEAQNG